MSSLSLRTFYQVCKYIRLLLFWTVEYHTCHSVEYLVKKHWSLYNISDSLRNKKEKSTLKLVLYSLYRDTIKALIKTENSLCCSSNNDNIDMQSLACKHSYDYPYFASGGFRREMDSIGLKSYLCLSFQWIFNIFLVRVPTLNTQWCLLDCSTCSHTVHQWITSNYTKAYIKKN